MMKMGKKAKNDALSAEMESYLSRDLRQVIREVLAMHRINADKRLVEDIYDLVLVEATDVQYRGEIKRLDRMVESILQKTGM